MIHYKRKIVIISIRLIVLEYYSVIIKLEIKIDKQNKILKGVEKT